MKSTQSDKPLGDPVWHLVTKLAFLWTGAFLLLAIMGALASCSSLGKLEQKPSGQPPACNQREPGLDSGDPPDSTDWMAWARAYVVAQYAVVDRDNKRAATADCLDDIAGIKP